MAVLGVVGVPVSKTRAASALPAAAAMMVSDTHIKS
jgi:hypothetical protein